MPNGFVSNVDLLKDIEKLKQIEKMCEIEGHVNEVAAKARGIHYPKPGARPSSEPHSTKNLKVENGLDSVKVNGKEFEYEK